MKNQEGIKWRCTDGCKKAVKRAVKAGKKRESSFFCLYMNKDTEEEYEQWQGKIAKSVETIQSCNFKVSKCVLRKK